MKVYEKAVSLISDKSQYKHFKKDLFEKEATLFSNMAACFKQGQHSKKEIEYCTKVVERSPYISDLTMLAKAYLRRAYAYDNLEKYQEAREDLMSVRQLDPNNLQASKVLERVEKSLK